MDNNRANQLNPNNGAFWTSRGYEDRPMGWMDVLSTILSLAYVFTKSDNDNRSNQMNPNNPVYWLSRGQTKP